MGAADAAWLRMDRPTNHMIITSVLLFDAPLDHDTLRAVVNDRLIEPFPPFRRRVADGRLGGPAWVDDEAFDLDLHLHRVALPAPGDDAALRALVADLMARPLDPDRPLWELHQIDGHGPGCAVVSRMHHCIADGIALARVMLTLTDGAPTARPAAGHPHRSRTVAALHAPWDAASWVAHGSLQTIAHPGRLVDAGHEAYDDARALAELLSTPTDPPGPLKRAGGVHGVAQRVAWTAPIPLAAVSALAHATRTTVNDVLVAALAGALERHLAHAGTAVDEVHAMVPFNIRPLDEPLPADLGNRFGLVLLALPTHAAAPLDRLADVHRRMAHIKRSRQPAVSYAVLGAMGRAPAGVEAQLIDLFSSRSTAVVTNVPGPRETLYLAGVPIRSVLVWAPCAGSIGMSVSMFSYRGEITVGFMTHAGLVDDPAGLALAVEDELAALTGAAQPSPSA
jgi:WS/DGAT/MGAT family acyltransferase